ncbi:Solitary outer membrane autotransporter beta-barrel domain [Marinimicrobium locisalis]|uniref:Solitary outer membrane autotransporter beta-barrel domain n=1 Tax=Marinimicrobium locisalis TaxID=546022 RepID=UPI003221CA97
MSLKVGGHRPRWLMALASCFWCATGSAQTADGESAAKLAERQAESAFATSVVLTDTEVLTLGLLSFDPGSFIPVDEDQFGTEESISRRDSVTTFALPWQWKLAPEESRLVPYIEARLSFLRTKQNIIRGAPEPEEQDATPSEQDTSDENRDRVYGGYLGGGLSHTLTEKWQLDAGAGLHLLRYQNSYQASTSLLPAGREDIAGLVSDTAATALMGEVRARFTYNGKFRGVPWKYQSTYSYYAGDTLSTAQGLDNVEPTTWSWANGITAYWDLPDVLNTSNKLRVLARRIDVGGDVTRTLGADRYYQIGVGWLFDMEGDPEWLDNLGVSVMMNYGSALSGGSLLLLYNEDW